ncbi:MAG TPA: glycosyltransferase family 39 protein [Mycobacteriales bacterium]|nr:glycosyltransferase family 39 protein [Mycobacteriales bacterium]
MRRDGFQVGRSARGVAGWVDRHAPRIAAVAGAGYALAGTAYAVGLGDRLRYFDERVYVGLARDLVAGHGYTLDHVHPTAYRPPGYPFLLAAVDAAGGGIVAMRLLGVAAMVGLVWLAYRFGVLVSGRVAGALAALVTAGYPLLVFTAGTLYPQVHSAFLLLLGLYLGMRGTAADTGRRRWGYLLGAGVSFGVLILAVPTFGPSVLAVAGWLGWRAVRGRPDRARLAGLAPVVVLLAVTAVLPAVWCVRNAVRLHAFVPVSTNNGVNLLLGNSRNATTGGGRVTDISGYEDTARARGLSEVEQDAFYRDQAVDWIRAHPADAVTLYAGKVLNNFNFRNELATSGQNSPTRDLISALSFYPLLALFALRLALARRGRAGGVGGIGGLERLLIGIVLGNVLLLAVFYTRLRFRVPLDAVMIISSAAALADLFTRRTAPRTPDQSNSF